MSSYRSTLIKVMAWSLALPSTILGSFWAFWSMHEAGLFSQEVALGLMLLVVLNSLYWIVRYGIKRKN